ncbi:CoA transferase [Streptomyces sp. NPDC048483]|uniref:CoA transferase n=1 Tax=Streptomyces sp. NPDC048483 TaxID=3154927 RepID=UPI003439919D
MLDLKHPAVLHRVLSRAEVFVQNLAPGAAQRLGPANAELTERRPRPVPCAISGYGEGGRIRTARRTTR